MKTIDTTTLETYNVFNYLEAVNKINKENLLNDSPEATARVEEIRNGLTDAERQAFDEVFNPRLKQALKRQRIEGNSKKANRMNVVFAGTFVTLFTAGIIFLYADYGTFNGHEVVSNSSDESSSVSVW
jgi:hypothetical protein